MSRSIVVLVLALLNRHSLRLVVKPKLRKVPHLVALRSIVKALTHPFPLRRSNRLHRHTRHILPLRLALQVVVAGWLAVGELVPGASLHGALVITLRRVGRCICPFAFGMTYYLKV